MNWVKDYTDPLPRNSYIQPMFTAIPGGFAFMGLRGIGVTVGASLAATAVERHTRSRALAVVAGAATGAATAAGLSRLQGPIGIATVVGGGLLGGMQAFRGDKSSRVRDAAGNATLINGLFLPGTSKIAGAIGSGVGASLDASPWAQAALGAASGAALGFGLSSLGMAPAGMAMTVGLSAAAGGLGPLFGPRFSQGFRNLASDSGNKLLQGLEKAGLAKAEGSHELAKGLGAFPSQFLKEGLRGFINSDFQLSGMLVGGVTESLELVELFWEDKHLEKQEAKQDAKEK